MIPSKQKELFAGRYGEFIAAAALEAHGLHATHVDVYEDDLWCKTPAGKLIRVQVKAASRPVFEKVSTKTPSYRYSIQLRQKPYEGVHLFVALDLKLCFARKWNCIPPQSVRLKHTLFSEEAQTRTFEKEFDL
tara:strand:- start:4417 stop:4815 length:399 start_codon:yes stop_codon:yes gene_type:complete